MGLASVPMRLARCYCISLTANTTIPGLCMRHDLVNSVICNKLKEIHLQPTAEGASLGHYSPARPEDKREKRKRADIAVDYFMKSKAHSDMIDVTLVNPRSSSRSISRKSKALGHLSKFEKVKSKKYKKEIIKHPNSDFTPFVISIFGSFGEKAEEWLCSITNYIESQLPWIDAKKWKRSLIMSISTVLHEMNYKAYVLGRRHTLTKA